MTGLKVYTSIVVASYAAFGFSLLIAPNPFLTLFGCPLDMHGALVARTFAASLLGSAAMHMGLRTVPLTTTVWRPVLVSNIIFNGISAIIMSIGVLQGAMHMLGILPVLLNLVLTWKSVRILVAIHLQNT
jgi:hypothetical protein